VEKKEKGVGVREGYCLRKARGEKREKKAGRKGKVQFESVPVYEKGKLADTAKDGGTVITFGETGTIT